MVEWAHGNDHLLGEVASQDVDDLLNEGLTDLHWLFTQVGQGFHLVNVKVGVASTIELVVDLEQPSVHIQVVCNKLGE